MPSDLKGEAAEVASRANLMNILGYLWIRNQFDLCVIKSDPGKSDGRRDVCILGILGGGDPRRAHSVGIVRGKLHVKSVAVGQQDPHGRQIGDIGMQLASEYGIIGKALLLRKFDFAVPIGAFDQPYGNALAVLFCKLFEPAQGAAGPTSVA